MGTGVFVCDEKDEYVRPSSYAPVKNHHKLTVLRNETSSCSEPPSASAIMVAENDDAYKKWVNPILMLRFDRLATYYPGGVPI